MAHSMAKDWNDGCAYGLEDRDCESDEIYLDTCSGDRRQKFNFRYLPSGEVLITLGTDPNTCLSGGRPHLRPCNPDSSNHRWRALDGKNFQTNKFEIGKDSIPGKCLTQHHHPKQKEVVEMIDCAVERRDHTTFWEKYYP